MNGKRNNMLKSRIKMQERLDEHEMILEDRMKDVQEARRTRSKKLKALERSLTRSQTQVNDSKAMVDKVDTVCQDLLSQEKNYENEISNMNSQNRIETKNQLHHVGDVQKELSRVRSEMKTDKNTKEVRNIYMYKIETGWVLYLWWEL